MLLKRVYYILLSLIPLFLWGCSDQPFKRYDMEQLHFPATLGGFQEFVSENAYPNLTFNSPTHLTYRSENGHISAYVCEWPGKVLRFTDTTNVTSYETYLDIQDRVGFGVSEEGLFSIAFSPQFETDPYFWLAYAGKGEPRRLVIEQFHENQSTQVVTSSGIVKTIETTTHDHKGGQLLFDTDGYLYIGVGDGGPQGDPEGHAQNLNSLRGKILRVLPEPMTTAFSIPDDNPFVGLPNHRGEIWAYGLRHPWRFSFDRLNGDLWVGDVGFEGWEEVNKIIKGQNYGWNAYEGSSRFDTSVTPTGLPISPVYEYIHSNDTGLSITGGYVYRGNEWPELYGQYIFADFISGRIFALKLAGDEVLSNREIAIIPGVSSIAETLDGELRFVSLVEGKILKLRKRVAEDDLLPKKLSATGIYISTTKKRMNPGLMDFEVNMPLWSDGLLKKRFLGIPNGEKITFDGKQRDFPVQTVFIKNFYETKESYAREQPLETRIFIRLADDWHGFTYRWDTDGNDATLVEKTTPAVINGSTWIFPGPDQCLQCHGKVVDRVLGFKSEQLNLTKDFPIGSHNQLKVLRDYNYLNLLNEEEFSEPLPKLADESINPELRVKSYLDANCSHCHQYKGSAPSYMDFRYPIAIKDMKILNEDPKFGDFGIASAKIIYPGNYEKSILWKRIHTLDSIKRMPLIGSSRRDEVFIALLEKWINNLQ